MSICSANLIFFNNNANGAVVLGTNEMYNIVMIDKMYNFAESRIRQTY